MKNIFVISFLLLLQLATHAQKKGQGRIDSLMHVLQSASHDTIRVKTLNLLSFDLKSIGKVDTALLLSSSSLELAKEINFTRGEADAYFFLGQAYAAKAKSTDALINYLSAQKLYEQLKRNVELAETYYGMGSVHQRSNYDEAQLY